MAILKGVMRRVEEREGVSKKTGKEYYIRKVMFLEDNSDESIPISISREFDFDSLKGKHVEIEVNLERAGYDIKASLVER